MFRKLATLLVLVPLSLNGLWMLCADGKEAPASTPQQPSASQHCKMMCPVQKPIQTGAICVLTTKEDGGSMLLFAVALASPPETVQWSVPAVVEHVASSSRARYSSPALATETPPPEV
jgi:hypothetical protein